MTTPASPRRALRWFFLAALLVVGFSAYRVVAADTPQADPEPPTATAVPSNLGSVAGAVAAQTVSNSVVAARADETATAPSVAQAGIATPVSSTTTFPVTTSSTIPEAPTTTVTTVAPPTTLPPTTTTTHVHPTTTTTAPSTTTTTVPATTTTVPPTTTTTTPPPSGVLSEDEARDLFALYFPADEVETALRVAICESSLNPSAYNPAGYGGLFQHSLEYWPSRAEAAGWAGASVYDPHANSAVAAWLHSQSGWSPWPNC